MATQKPAWPDIAGFSNYRTYLAAFVAAGRKRGAAYSQRALARKLKWPRAYLSDVLHGRKSFTVPRALQFAKAMKLDSYQVERLLFLTLKESDDPEVGAYFERVIAREGDDTSRTTPVERALWQRVETMAVFEAIKWAGTRLAPAEIKRLLFSFPSLDEARIAAIVAELERNDIVVYDPKTKTTIFPGGNLFQDDLDADAVTRDAAIHKQFAMNFINYWSNPQAPFCLNSAFVRLPLAGIDTVKSRMVMLRNWLFDLDEALSKSAKPEPSLVFQLDLNLFPITALPADGGAKERNGARDK
jgi:hypothetical protein